MNLITTFQDRFGDWLTALLEHLQISLSALLLAIIISVPLAIVISNSKRLSEIILQISGVFQTIPSLALLGLFIPFMGIGTVPAVAALVIYALFPILQNTITGLATIDPSLKEAGRAFGMNKWERLKKFELALAMPVIVSGVRTAAVMIIGTATLAALIGAGGLGSFILLGIDRNNPSLILIGAISSALLAILFNLAIKYLEKSSFKKVLLSLALLTISLGAFYVPKMVQMTQNKDKIVIAGKLGPEPEILINMYKELIEQDSNLSVTLKPNFGKTSFLYEALKKGDIDIYPEFSGTITASLLKDPPKTSNNPQTVYQQARDGILKQDNLVYLKPMTYQNTYAVAVTRSLAKQYSLKNISDLKEIENTAKAGFTLEFNDREDGNKGLKSLYGLNLQVSTMEPALRYQAIESGDIAITDAYSTDAEIKQYDLTVLKDDKELFPPYQGAPLLRQSLLKKYPELKAILNQLAGKISEAEMSEMNYQVKVKGKTAQSVARAYLKKQGLLK